MGCDYTPKKGIFLNAASLSQLNHQQVKGAIAGWADSANQEHYASVMNKIGSLTKDASRQQRVSIAEGVREKTDCNMKARDIFVSNNATKIVDETVDLVDNQGYHSLGTFNPDNTLPLEHLTYKHGGYTHRY